MKHISLFLVLGLACLKAGAQRHFNLWPTPDSSYAALTSVAIRDGLYYTSGPVYNGAELKFAVYDSAGSLVRKTSYTHPGRRIQAWPAGLCPLPDGGFVVLADAYPSGISGVPRAAIIRLDSLGAVTMYREYAKTQCPGDSVVPFADRFARDLKPDGQGGWLLLTAPRCPCDPSYPGYFHHDWSLTRLDSAFDARWTKTFGSAILDDIPFRILVEPDGYLLAGSQHNDNIQSWGASFRARIVKTDTAGAVLWTWLSDFTRNISGPSDVVRTADGGYLYCGSTGQEMVTAGGMFWKGWIEKLDAARNTQWTKTTGYWNYREDLVRLRVVRSLPGGDVLVAGSATDSSLTSHYADEAYGTLLRVAPGGMVRWQRKYRHPGLPTTATYIIRDAEPVPDGGFSFAGEAGMGSVYRGWLVKVDSNGCENPQCLPATTAAQDGPTVSAGVSVYPNPVRETLHIRCAAGSAKPFLHLTDLAGRTVLQSPLRAGGETVVGTGPLPPGTYLYRITDGARVLDRGKVVKQ